MLLGLTLQGQLEPVLSILSPGTHYDAAIPTLEAVVGHDFGDDDGIPRTRATARARGASVKLRYCSPDCLDLFFVMPEVLGGEGECLV